MKAKPNKFYVLGQNKSYFCVTIQRMIKFCDPIVIKAETAGILDKIHYGYIVDTSSKFGPDYESNLCEIEFTDDDIVREYQLRDMSSFFYIDSQL